ncbi:MAG TPA: tRNA lysidine(34) synthetase TilS, partial [Clostridiales bacterium UBA8960]|nr:tRNA lysidine(34) synthetase TilS [Clostridiales bacterium UBA8960]
MIEKMLSTIKQNQLIEYGDKIVVGLSGGADSLSLTHALLSLKEMFGLEIMAVHINHMLRGEAADADAGFVEAFCLENHLPFKIYKVNVTDFANEKGLSFEEAGRIVRYEKFYEALGAFDAHKIAVAQNRNDVLETFFINLLRGSGIDGLSSIDYKRDGVIIRPLLDIERSEIDQYCLDNGLIPRYDHTNDENDYLRNKVRNVLLPDLRENYNPSLDDAVMKTVNIMRCEKSFWHDQNEKRFHECCTYENDVVTIGTTVYDALHPAEKNQLIRYAVKRMKGNLTNLSYDQINQIARLKRTGSMCRIDDRLSIRRSHNALIMYFEDQILEPSEKKLFVKKVPL